MKTYKKVVVEAVNTPSGSYSAGCPANNHGAGWDHNQCRRCERTM